MRRRFGYDIDLLVTPMASIPAFARTVTPAGAELPPLPGRLWRYRVDHDHVVTWAAYSSSVRSRSSG